MNYLALLLLLWAAEQAHCVTVIEDGETYDILGGTTKTDLVCSADSREAYWYSDGGTFPAMGTPSRFLTFNSPFTKLHHGKIACYLDNMKSVTLRFKEKPKLQITLSNYNFKLNDRVIFSCQAEPPIPRNYLKFFKNKAAITAGPDSNLTPLDISVTVTVDLLTDEYACMRTDTNEKVEYEFQLKTPKIDIERVRDGYMSYTAISPKEFGTMKRLTCVNDGTQTKQTMSASVILADQKEVELPLGKKNKLYFVKKLENGLDIYILSVQMQTIGTYKCYEKTGEYKYETTLYMADKLIVKIKPSGPITMFKGEEVYLKAMVPLPLDGVVQYRWTNAKGAVVGENPDFAFTTSDTTYGVYTVQVNSLDGSRTPAKDTFTVQDVKLKADNPDQNVRNGSDFIISCTLIGGVSRIKDVTIVSTNQDPNKRVDPVSRYGQVNGNQIIFSYKRVYQRDTDPLMFKCELLTQSAVYSSEPIKVVVGRIECSDQQRACDDQKQCIPWEKFCDKRTDCNDGSDENADGACSPCNPVNEFECKIVTDTRGQRSYPGRRCVNMIWACDGEDDCGNGYDESLTACSSRRERGPDNSFYEFCLPSEYRCAKGTDPTFKNTRYMCPSLDACLPIGTLCDGTDDCPTTGGGAAFDETLSQCVDPVLVKPEKTIRIEKFEGDWLADDDLVCEARFFGRPQIIFLKNWKYIPKEKGQQTYISARLIEQNGHRGLSTCVGDKFETTRTKQFKTNRPLTMDDAGIYTCEFTDIGGRRIFSPDMILVIKRKDKCGLRSNFQKSFHNAIAQSPGNCYECNCLGHQIKNTKPYCVTDKTAEKRLKQSHHAQVTTTKYNELKIGRMTDFSGAFDKDGKYGGTYNLESIRVDDPWLQYLVAVTAFDEIQSKYSLYDATIEFYIIGTRAPQAVNRSEPNLPDIVIMAKNAKAIGAFNCYPSTITTEGQGGNNIMKVQIKSNMQTSQCQWRLIEVTGGQGFRSPRPATPAEIMSVLEDFQSFRFRYMVNRNDESKATTSISIINVTYAEFKSQDVLDANLAEWVPKCFCAKEYTGNWCQNCATGYERAATRADPYQCVPQRACAKDQFITETMNCQDCYCGLRGTVKSNELSCTEDKNVYESSKTSLEEMDSYKINVTTTDVDIRMKEVTYSYGVWEGDRKPGYYLMKPVESTATDVFSRYFRVRFPAPLDKSYIDAYGLRLTFTMGSESSSSDRPEIGRKLTDSDGDTPELVIGNRERDCIYYAKLDKMRFNEYNQRVINIKAHESVDQTGWKYCGTNQYATREQILKVLSTQPRGYKEHGGVFLRVQYYNELDITSRISAIKMFYMTDARTDTQLHGIERCTKCPGGVKGSRCTECIPGANFVWQLAAGSNYQCATQFSMSCNCHGKSECDSSLKCTNCRDNTAGRNCEHCKIGFYGDPPRGVECKPCRCPDIPTSGNYFASQCIYQRDNTVFPSKCVCKTGYRGVSCESCDDNFVKAASGACEQQRRSGRLAAECDSWGTFRGTTPVGKLIRAIDGKCDCKENVLGTVCDRCKEGYVKITDKNIGCVKCICSYVSTECSVAKYSFEQFDVLKSYQEKMKSGSVNNTVFVSTIKNQKLSGFANFEDGSIKATYSNQRLKKNGTKEYFIRFPKEVLPQLPSTLSGSWSYGVTSLNSGKIFSVNRTFVVFQSEAYDGKEYLIGTQRQKKYEEFNVEDSSEKFSPNAFSLLDDQFRPKKHHINEATLRFVISNLKAAYICIPLDSAIDFSLTGFSIEILARGSSGNAEFEKCKCPAQYDGDWCQKCAPGFERKGRKLPDGSFDMKDKCVRR